ncbi:MAG: hypothetical protein ACI89T_001222 [Cognaticolwellia sp.]|jgi:hypothetical protein
MNSIDLFVQNWASKQAMTPIDNTDIAELEERLAAILPDSYKYLLSNYGLVHTPNVLTKICDLGVDITEVQDFLSLEDVYSLSKLYEMSGMPKGHILFASDCKGNMFCFKLSDCESNNKDIPVWFFDHDLRTFTKVGDTFSAWLGQFM